MTRASDSGSSSGSAHGGRCPRCGSTPADGRFCPRCGAALVVHTAPSDPWIGTNLAGRYEIVELIKRGGMGSVYRAEQRWLEREVAVKVIHPHLSTSEEVVKRFVAEAKAASRLNHPGIVSIFDFGCTPAEQGSQLFLVMELLVGPDLGSVLERETALPVVRAVDILLQVLAALDEAHHAGIVHRDVKPENVILEPGRAGTDRVKLIDFGIAKWSGLPKLTGVGRLVGTPRYMAPELALEQAVGPSADLYAAGILLFEMLTGFAPFEGESSARVLELHCSAPRPDPRGYGRYVPDELANACLHAIDVNPASRFADARAFARAVAESVPGGARRAGFLLSSRPASGVRENALPTVPAAAPSARPISPTEKPSESREDVRGSTLPARFVPPPRSSFKPSVSFVGRDEELRWFLDALSPTGEAAAVVVWGGPGVGRSRLIDEACSRAATSGARVVRVNARPPPWGEVGYSGLRLAIRALAGLGPDEALLEGPTSTDSEGAAGLRFVFGGRRLNESDSAVVRRSVAAALSWAARRALAGSAAGWVILAIDDAECMDGATLAALCDLIDADRIPGFVVLMASESAPEGASIGSLRALNLHGLTRSEATPLLAEGPAPLPATLGDDISPLYLCELRRLQAAERSATAPDTLEDLLLLRLGRLGAAELRTLQAIAVSGGASRNRLAGLLARSEDVDDAWAPLVASGLVDENDDVLSIRHKLIARIVVERAAAGAIADLHARVADELGDAGGPIELRAYHLIRGRPDFEAFFLLEESARLRSLRGDRDGAQRALNDGVQAARSEMMRGDADIAARAFVVLSRKLGAALLDVGNVEQAYGVLDEALDLAEPHEIERARLLELLATIAWHRGRSEEADARRREARAVAVASNDETLIARLNGTIPRVQTGRYRRIVRPSMVSVSSIPPRSSGVDLLVAPAIGTKSAGGREA